jgi:hypothetical protein
MGYIPSFAAKKFPAYYATVTIIAVVIQARHKTFGVWHETEFHIQIAKHCYCYLHF